MLLPRMNLRVQNLNCTFLLFLERGFTNNLGVQFSDLQII